MPKHVGLLQICGRQWKWTPIPLHTVRQFHYEEISLRSLPEVDVHRSETVEAHLVHRVEGILAQLNAAFDEKQHLHGHFLVPDRLREPLIRLKVDHSGGYATISPVRFGQRFIGKVANGNDIVTFYRRPLRPLSNRINADGISGRRRDTLVRGILDEDDQGETGAMTLNGIRVTPSDVLDGQTRSIEAFHVSILDLVRHVLRKNKLELDVLPERELCDAVEKFVTKSEPRAIPEYVEQRIREICCLFQEQNPGQTDMGMAQLAAWSRQVTQSAVRSATRVPIATRNAHEGGPIASDITNRTNDDTVEAMLASDHRPLAFDENDWDVLGIAPDEGSCDLVSAPANVCEKEWNDGKKSEAVAPGARSVAKRQVCAKGPQFDDTANDGYTANMKRENPGRQERRQRRRQC